MSHEIHHPIKIAVVGAGNVGATFAYTMVLSGLATEIVLIDANHQKAEGEAMDINHAIPLAHPARVWAGDYQDCAGALVTVITAGSAQKTGETRLDLVQRNAGIIRKIIPEVIRYNPEGIILVASNPVDILTYITLKETGLSRERVMGSGTILDTARFRYLISQKFKVDARSVHAYIIGEHGDSEVPVWSLANIAGMQIPVFCKANHMNCSKKELDEIFKNTLKAAYHIIERKGATYYAIGAGLVKIVEAIIRDQGTVLSISSLIHGYYGIEDVCLSLPSIIDRRGIVRVINLELDEHEILGIQNSAKILRHNLDMLFPT